MTIEEIKKSKEILETELNSAINKLIERFEEDTKTSVDGISVEMQELRLENNIVFEKRFFANVHIKNPYED